MPFYIGPNSQRTEELSHNKIPNKITTSEVKNKAFSVKKKKKSFFCINLIEHHIVILCQCLIVDYFKMSRIKIISQFVMNIMRNYRIY